MHAKDTLLAETYKRWSLEIAGHFLSGRKADVNNNRNIVVLHISEMGCCIVDVLLLDLDPRSESCTLVEKRFAARDLQLDMGLPS